MYEHGEQEMGDEEFAQNIVAASDPEEIRDRLRELEQLGASVIVLQNNSAGNTDRAIEVLGEAVLPALRGARV
jgi:alkanesulfonate monooxygenase SsuD/methylene tetrahydromethanopterin reductase-like flavin-dependent oxidoreductase (luciferase family)